MQYWLVGYSGYRKWKGLENVLPGKILRSVKGFVLVLAGVFGVGMLVGVAPAAHATTCAAVSDRNAYDGGWKGGEHNTLVTGFNGMIGFGETKYTKAGSEPVVWLGQFTVDAKNLLTKWSGTQLIGDGSTVDALVSTVTCDANNKPISFTADVVNTTTDHKKTDLGTFTLNRVAMGSVSQ
ncbi:hypothetical protein [Nocardia sp. NPDC050175]|uniref:hypothetical protein n=1 Tax=Nocardia sp. NPDC050175 TaxID=3364317 RepID=UPI0037AE9F82